VIVSQQLSRRGDDIAGPSADKLGGSRLDTLGPLGYVAHHEHRFSERGGFFLNSSGVGQDNVRSLERASKIRVAQGIDKSYSGAVAQLGVDGVAYGRVRMHRNHDTDVVMGVRKRANGATDTS